MFQDIQAEHKIWVEQMFPGLRPQHHGLLGSIEEWGELWEATRRPAIEDVKDAVADITIFLINYANCHGITLKIIEAGKPSPENIIHVAYWLTKMASAQLKMEQTAQHGAEERYKDRDFVREIDIALHAVMAQLAIFSRRLGFDYEATVRNTWSKVKERRRANTTPVA